jgi:hypothetical protein
MDRSQIVAGARQRVKTIKTEIGSLESELKNLVRLYPELDGSQRTVDRSNTDTFSRDRALNLVLDVFRVAGAGEELSDDYIHNALLDRGNRVSLGQLQNWLRQILVADGYATREGQKGDYSYVLTDKGKKQTTMRLNVGEGVVE